MTHSCKAGECSITCEKGCGCIGSGSNCECVCDDSTSALKTFEKTLERSDRLDVNINELSLGKVAVLLNAASAQEISVASGDAARIVSLDVKGVTLAEAVNQLGLQFA